MEVKLDKWQQDILDTKGNIVLCSGRQVGKSTVISIDAGEYAIKNPNKTILIIASVERQALLLFEKVLGHIHDNHKKYIKKGKDKPTKHTLRLTNGSTIHCLPTGISGYGIRGYTIDRLYADEAAFIPEEVWTAVTPMLATTGGDIILLSTPFGRRGYFYRCFSDKSFTSFHVSSEECERVPKEFLEQEKLRMTALQYQQEYLGLFIDELRQYFSDKIIKACMMESIKEEKPDPKKEYYLGVDVARMGEDRSSYQIFRKEEDGTLFHVYNHTTSKTLLTWTVKDIIELDFKYNFKRILVDDGGLGAGVFDMLISNEQVRGKTVAINNLKRAREYNPREKPASQRIAKELLYEELLMMMEQNKIKLLDNPEIFLSLKSAQYEYREDDRGQAKIKIYGLHNDIREGIIRAVYGSKQKSLKLFVDYI